MVKVRVSLGCYDLLKGYETAYDPCYTDEAAWFLERYKLVSDTDEDAGINFDGEECILVLAEEV